MGRRVRTLCSPFLFCLPLSFFSFFSWVFPSLLPIPAGQTDVRLILGANSFIMTCCILIFYFCNLLLIARKVNTIHV